MSSLAHPLNPDTLAADRVLQTAALLGQGERKAWALRVWFRLHGAAFPALAR